MESKIIIAADIVPTESNIKYFVDGDIDYLIGEKLKERLNEACFIAMNLEVPLVDCFSPIRKCGPCLAAPTSTITGIQKINPYFFTLANNHILDQGIAGLDSTVTALKMKGIEYSGIGKDLTQARKPYIKNINNKKLGIYCCSEHEYSIASDSNPGANPYDPLESFDEVKALRDKCDYLIVLYHGGKEHYRYPSPIMQRVFRKFAEVGADLVVAQHTHCVGCKEEYKGSTLIYGQGNFLFDYSDNDFWKTSLLIEVDLNRKLVSYIPIMKDGNKVREAEAEEKQNILSGFYARSEEILKPGIVDEKYTIFADEMAYEYLVKLSGGFAKTPFVRLINKLTSYGYIKLFYDDKYKVVIENVLDCEAHRELAAKTFRGK